MANGARPPAVTLSSCSRDPDWMGSGFPDRNRLSRDDSFSSSPDPYWTGLGFRIEFNPCGASGARRAGATRSTVTDSRSVLSTERRVEPGRAARWFSPSSLRSRIGGAAVGTIFGKSTEEFALAPTSAALGVVVRAANRFLGSMLRSAWITRRGHAFILASLSIREITPHVTNAESR